MDTPEQKILRQSFRQLIEGVNDEINVVESARTGRNSAELVMNFGRKSAGENPGADIVADSFSRVRSALRKSLEERKRSSMLDYLVTSKRARSSENSGPFVKLNC